MHIRRYAAAFVLGIVVTLTFGMASDSGRDVRLPTYGFSIDELASERDGESMQALAMFLPPNGGFAANVNVMIQPYDGSIDAYRELSRRQFGQMGLTVLSEEKSEDSVTWEYTGALQGRSLHWYATATKRGKDVYLVTGTALNKNWKTEGKALKECVNSFVLTDKDGAVN